MSQQEEIQSILPALEKALAIFEAYEKKVYASECCEATNAISALLVVLRDNLAVLPTGSQVIACEQADEVRFQLAVYAKHTGSVTITHMRMRQSLTAHLRHLIENVKRLLATPPTTTNNSSA